MEITVTMTATFSDAGGRGRMTRPVAISEQEWDGEIEDVLEAVFLNGQNDVQPVEGRPSVSTGDTIHIADHPGSGSWRVMPVGFRPLDHGEPVVAPAEEERRNLREFGRLNEPGKAPLHSPAARTTARTLVKLKKIAWVDAQLKRALRANPLQELSGGRTAMKISEIVAGGWLTESEIRWRISPKSGLDRQEMKALAGYEMVIQRGQPIRFRLAGLRFIAND